MLQYDVIVIGFGKAGKTLAAKLATAGKQVALIEKSKAMYGGTCINIACIPTKTLIVAAEKGWTFDQAMSEKGAVTSRLNAKNYANVTNSGVTVFDATAHFLSNKVIEVVAGDERQELTADTIIINTGARPRVPAIPGLADSQFVYDSTGIQSLSSLPERLGILGGGNIGLEFAHLYQKLGSQVTVLDSGSTFLPRVEPSIAKLAKEYIEEDGIVIEQGVQVSEIRNDGHQVVVKADQQEYRFDALLYATGRVPNIQDLTLENTDIQTTERGAIRVDQHLQTTVPGIFAVGDVNGGPQFTYISLDDSRIVLDYLTGQGLYSLESRGALPTALFISPTLASVGLTEQEAKEQGLPVLTKELLVAAMPRGHVNGDLRGAFKAVVHAETKEILGATLLSQDAAELINIISLSMDYHITATDLSKQIFTHPTMAENLNDLFAF
ncbi:FAD-containing oxidoreductase [Streptococcus sp. DD13]|uniref:FAD-containing oxidoreductase n=1 Tax=Streptococcus sp. DD13 TaxID=1777881 RepID=UPI000793BD08|nr:FAD-containing oxidoreductase [Streptococcus sp. DD13]KXT79057.1 putative dehydrogenase or reductase [Streptococcus sp. DD13]